MASFASHASTPGPKKVGGNNGQLRFVRHHGWRTQAHLYQNIHLKRPLKILITVYCSIFTIFNETFLFSNMVMVIQLATTRFNQKKQPTNYPKPLLNSWIPKSISKVLSLNMVLHCCEYRVCEGAG